MPNFSPLDAPPPDPGQQQKIQATKIFALMEALLWVGRILGAVLYMESWAGASEMLILSGILLAILYLCVPHLIMGSQERTQTQLAYGIGAALALALSWRVLRFANWPGASVVSVITLLAVILVVVFYGYVLLSKPSRWKEGTFYKHALVRLILAILIV